VWGVARNRLLTVLIAMSALLAVNLTLMQGAEANGAALPTVTTPTVVAGDRVAYAQWTATEADNFDWAVYSGPNIGDPVVIFSGPSIPVPRHLLVSDALLNGVTYWFAVTANNGAGSVVSNRVAFTMNASVESGIGTVESLSAQGFDGGVQYYVNATGAMQGVFYVLFQTNTGWNAAVQWSLTDGAPNAFEPFSTGSGFPNATTYYWSAIPFSGTGFGAWATRLPATTVATAGQPFVTNNPPEILSATIRWTTPSVASGKAISGYRISYTTDGGLNWATQADVGLVNTYTATGLSASSTYRFRVAALVDGATGGWSNASGGLTPLRNTSVVSWSPTNTTAVVTTGLIAPDALATTNSDGAISYAIALDGSSPSSNCAVNATTAVLTFSGAGTCTVRATVTQTATFTEATRSVSFNITAPIPPSPDGGGGGGPSTPDPTPAVSPAPTPAPEPTLNPEPTPDPTEQAIEVIRGLAPSEVAALTAAQVQALPPQAFAAMSPAQVRALQPRQVANLSGPQIRAIPPEAIRAMQPRTLNKLSLRQIRQLTPEQVEKLRPKQISALGPKKQRSIERRR
jgi:hypothetical protein